MSKGAAIFGWARLLAPIILGNIPATRAIAPKVGGLMDEAEALKEAKGADKLAHVVTLSRGVGQAINAEKPGTVDEAALDAAVTGGIGTAFSVAHLLRQEHGAPAPATP
jgi:hypothetical protein